MTGPSHRRVGVGLIGLGTVGSGVYKIITQRYPWIDIHKIAVRDVAKDRGLNGLDAELLTDDPFSVVNRPDVDVLVEVMGGLDPARQVIEIALKAGKHVVTANKELIARHGPELFKLAEAHNARLLFEGAVAGGIPIIMPLRLSLAGNQIEQIAGILNGTTNFILTKMSQEGQDFASALADAQALGFAEADPTNDVEGFDAAYKLAILGSIAFRKPIDPMTIHKEGITKITPTEISFAEALGFTIKLIGLARQADDGRIDLRVHPMLVPHSHPLSKISNEFNAIFVRGDAVGDVMFYGRGAGEMPTASAVMGDVLAIATDLSKGNDPIPTMCWQIEGEPALLPIGETKNRYYLRLNTQDQPGVIGNIGAACGEHGVSIEMVMQKGIGPDGTACIVLITHEVTEGQMREALKKMEAQPTTASIGCVMRVL
jgi:homoserine dehydrogenase